jgi:hypothetical protein
MEKTFLVIFVNMLLKLLKAVNARRVTAQQFNIGPHWAENIKKLC